MFTLRNARNLLSLIPLLRPENRQIQPLKTGKLGSDALDKRIFDQAVKNKTRVKRLMSDELIPWIRRRNTPPFAKMEHDRIRAPLTLVFQIKTLNRYVRPPVGLRSSKDFVPIPVYKNVVYKDFWWRYLGPSKSYMEAKRETAKYVDKIYSMIHDYGLPIVAIRVFLVDWDADNAIPAKVLNWKIFYTKTFEGLKVDSVNLRSWGIASDKAEIDNTRYHAPNSAYWNKFTDTKDAIEAETGHSTSNVVSTAINNLIGELSKAKKNIIDIVYLKRIQFVATTPVFKERVERQLIDEYKKDDKLQKAAAKPSGDRALINRAMKLARADLEQRKLID